MACLNSYTQSSFNVTPVHNSTVMLRCKRNCLRRGTAVMQVTAQAAGCD